MCLAIPGKILSIDNSQGELVRTGRVSFGGIVKDVSLAYTPEAKVDDYVIVHVGFAINTIDESEAMRVFEYLKEMDELGEIEGEKDNGEKRVYSERNECN
jgi:hydrogenase expression/formation protein HypC